MRLLLIGNSHCAAVMAAHAAAPERWPGLVPDLRALPGGGMFGVRLVRGRLTGATAAVRADMARFWPDDGHRLGPADAVAIIGSNPVRGVAGLVRGWRSPALPSGAALTRALTDPDAAPAAADRVGAAGVQLIPHDLLTGMAEDVADRGLTAHCLRLIAPFAERRGLPVAVAAAPAMPEAAMAGPDADDADPMVAAIARGDGAAVTELARASQGAVLDRIAAEAGIALRHVDQPPATMAGPFATALRYTTGSVRLRGDGGADDPRDGHANADYGALMLDALLAALSRQGD